MFNVLVDIYCGCVGNVCGPNGDDSLLMKDTIEGIVAPKILQAPRRCIVLLCGLLIVLLQVLLQVMTESAMAEDKQTLLDRQVL